MDGPNLYKLLPAWYEFKLEKELSGNHTDVFWYIVQLHNRLGWPDKFNLPIAESAHMIHMASNTFRKVFTELESVGMVKVTKRSKNQYIANQISMWEPYQKLVKQDESTCAALGKANGKAVGKAHGKALEKHLSLNNTYNTNNIDNTYNTGNTSTNVEAVSTETPKRSKPKAERFNPMPEYISTQLEKLGLFGMDNDESTDAVMQWLDYKKNELKFTYKTESTFKAFLSELVKTGMEANQQIKDMVLFSIAKGWKGVYANKSQLQPQQNVQPNGRTAHPSGSVSFKIQAAWEEQQARDLATAKAMILNKEYHEKQAYIASLPDGHPEKAIYDVF